MELTAIFPPLTIERDFSVPATCLFDAWTTAIVAEEWLFKNETNEIHFEGDVQRGGKFSVVENNDGKIISHFGQFTNVLRPKTLQFTLEVPEHFEGTSEITIDIAQGPAGSRLTFTQKGIDTTKTKDAWQHMLANLDKILKQPYTIGVDTEKEEILTAISVVVMQMTGLILTLDEQQLNVVPYKGSWTAGQLLRHVTKSTRGVAAIQAKPGERASRNAHERIIELKQTFLDITSNMQSPGEIVPEEERYTLRQSVENLQQTIQLLKENTKAADVTELLTGLPFGPVTKLELLHFVLYHTQRHLFQLKRITDAVK